MSDFYAQSSMYGSFAKSARFAIRILPSGSNSLLLQRGYGDFMRNFTYLCESAELPGRGLLSYELRYYGPTLKVPYQSEYQEATMTFLCRAESFERQFFDDWMEIINPTSTYDFNYKDSFKCEIQMFQFSESGRRTETESNRETPAPSPTSSQFTEPAATYAWTLHDAYPILVNPQPVTWADDNFQRLSIAFTYTKWTRKNRDAESRRFRLVNGALVIGDDASNSIGVSSDGGGPIRSGPR
jgi:hypothetical protein